MADRPRFVYEGQAHDGQNEFNARVHQTAAYLERTEQEEKRAHADRLADIRLRSVELAFRIYKDDPHTFGFDDVLALADHIVAYARDGQSTQDGASGFRFFGRK